MEEILIYPYIFQGENSAKRIELREEEFFVIDFLRNFEEEIYKYTKHSHRARWQDLHFKIFHEFFPPGPFCQ